MRRFIATKTKTKNLFDGKFANGVYNTTVGSQITFSPSVRRIGCLNPTKIKPNTAYTITAFKDGKTNFEWRSIQTNSDGIITKYIGSIQNNVKFTSEPNTEYVYFYFAEDITTTEGIKVQIEENSTSTDYVEPYIKTKHIATSIRPSRNLFDKNNPLMAVDAKVETDGKMYSEAGSNSIVCEVKPNTTYTIRYNTDGYSSGAPVGRLVSYSEYPVISQTVGTAIKSLTHLGGIFTTNSDTRYIAIWANRSFNVKQQVWDTTQLEEGGTATPYEPYGLIKETRIVGDVKNG